MGFTGHPVADLQGTDTLTQNGNAACEFMTGDKGVVGRPAVLADGAGENAGVGTADGDGLDFHQYLAVAGLRNGDGFDTVITGCVEHDGAHCFFHRGNLLNNRRWGR